MKREIYKIIKTTPYMIMWFVFIIAILLTLFSYGKNRKEVDVKEYYAERYQSKDDLSSIIEGKRNELNDYMSRTTATFYEEEINKINEEIALYQYLYDNDIKYDDFILDVNFNVSSFSNDKTIFINYMINTLTIFIIFIMCFFNIYLFNEDFATGMYKYIYICNNRISVIKNKSIISIFIALVLCAISIISTLILSMQYENNYSLIIFQYGKNIYSISNKMAIALDALFSFFEIIAFDIILISISLFIKKPIKALIIDAMVCLIIVLLVRFFNNNFVKFIFNDSLTVLYEFASIKMMIISLITKLLAISALFISSIIYFKKSNLII